MDELKVSGAGKTVSKLCKHADGTIAQAAKKLKDHWTQMVSVCVSWPVDAPEKRIESRLLCVAGFYAASRRCSDPGSFGTSAGSESRRGGRCDQQG